MITGLNHVDSFVAKMAPTAQAVGRKWNLPPSVIIAQAALETGWGQAVKGNAYFGIKQGASSNEAITFTTHEVIDGQKVTLVDRFRTYQSMQDATKAYAQFLHDTPRYHEALRDTSDPATFVEALQQAGYATDPQYAEKVKQIIQRYQLTAYDHPPQKAPPPEAPERSAQPVNQRRSRWSEVISNLPKYLTVPERRQPSPLKPGASQPAAWAQTYSASTPAAAAAPSRSAGNHAVNPDRLRTPSNRPANEVPPRQGQTFAAFPRLLWEQLRQFTWSHGRHRLQSAKSPADPPSRS
jgi:Mannosyl-glycoprotein endo-beta-N-acetylglucosaminidase